MLAIALRMLIKQRSLYMKKITVASGSIRAIIGISAFFAAACTPLAAFAATNLVANPSFEQGTSSKPTAWNFYSFGTGTFTSTYPVEGSGGTGTKAAEVSGSSVQKGAGSWSFNPIPVTPGQVYAFSDKYHASVETEIDVDYKVVAADSKPSECFASADPAYVDCYEVVAKSLPPTSSFTTFSTAIAPPAGTVSMTIEHLLTSDGDLTVDDYSVTAGVAASDAYPQGIVSLTFDDGPESAYTNIFPMLNAAPGGPMHGTFYIVSQDLNKAGFITTAQMQQIHSAGNDIGAHTANHCDLVALNKDPNSAMVAGTPGAPGVGCPDGALSAATTSQAEIQNGVIELNAAGIKNITDFAYPYGSYNEAIEAQVKNADLLGARSIDRGFNTKSTNPGALVAQEFDPSTSTSTVRAWIDSALASKTWLILVMHKVEQSTSTSAYTTSPELLQATIDYLASTHACVETVAQVMSGDTSCTSVASTTTHTITASAGTGGSVSPSGAVSVTDGASQSFTFAPDQGYSFASLMIDGSSIATTSQFTFSNVTTDHTIAATFSLIATTTGTSTPPTATSTPLAVTGVDAVRTVAQADNVFDDGWEWVIHLTVPTDENAFHIKFSDWTSGSASTIPAAGNIRVYSPQSSNASTPSAAIVEPGNGYSGWLYLNGDTASSTAGRQIDLHIGVRVPFGTGPGSYTTNFTAQSYPASATSSAQ
jgi:peptidoglycan/xylan/chitin deacetylase (PgdA/CDA1 family)